VVSSFQKRFEEFATGIQLSGAGREASQGSTNLMKSMAMANPIAIAINGGIKFFMPSISAVVGSHPGRKLAIGTGV
jgi:hypothetical protein